MAMSSQEMAKAALANFMKSNLVARMMWSIGTDLSQPRSSSQSKIILVTTSAVNKLAATPIVRETPNPLIEPVPMKIRMIEEINVVTWESKMVPKARL